MEAAREELVPAVDCCLLRLVHQDELLRQTQAAGVVARLECMCIYEYALTAGGDWKLSSVLGIGRGRHVSRSLHAK